MSPSTERCDVVIVGGGLVGTPLACALGEMGLSVALVEAALPPPLAADAPFETRVSAIAPASEHWLRALGIWSRMPAGRLCPYRRMRVWDQGGEIDFDAAVIPTTHLGTIIENRQLQQAALSALSDHAGVRLMAPQRAVRMAWVRDGVRLTLADGKIFEASLVVGADGADSAIRALAGIPTFGHGYDQIAIMALIETERPHQHTAWQRFLPDGPLAFLPLADGRCAVVWSCTTAVARSYLEVPDAVFLQALTDSSERRLGAVLACGPRLSFPLRWMHAARYVGSGWRWWGCGPSDSSAGRAGGQPRLPGCDRAHRGDPGRTLAGPRFREAWVLGRYQRLRRADNLLTAAAMDGFKYLFGNVNPVLSGLRNAGLSGVDRLGAVKRLIVGQAMGLESASSRA